MNHWSDGDEDDDDNNNADDDEYDDGGDDDATRGLPQFSCSLWAQHLSRSLAN